MLYVFYGHGKPWKIFVIFIWKSSKYVSIVVGLELMYWSYDAFHDANIM